MSWEVSASMRASIPVTGSWRALAHIPFGPTAPLRPHTCRGLKPIWVIFRAQVCELLPIAAAQQRARRCGCFRCGLRRSLEWRTGWGGPGLATLWALAHTLGAGGHLRLLGRGGQRRCTFLCAAKCSLWFLCRQRRVRLLRRLLLC